MLHLPDTDVLFPPRVISSLRHLRGPEWQQLIDRLSQIKDERHTDILAFALMMVRHTSCLSCHPHSFRALRGCTACAMQTIHRYKGPDRDLVKGWEEARQEIQHWLAENDVVAIAGQSLAKTAP
jgi:hypothetical protein